jgi:hypothetical protein
LTLNFATEGLSVVQGELTKSSDHRRTRGQKKTKLRIKSQTEDQKKMKNKKPNEGSRKKMKKKKPNGR